jgi:hypothetical protein
MKNIKYQVIKLTIPAQNTEVKIDAETDKQYATVKEMVMYCGTEFSRSRNLVVTSPIKFNSKEIFPEKFDTFLLFPCEDNKQYNFTEINEPAAGSKIEGRLKDVNPGVFPYEVTIVLTLSNG